MSCAFVACSINVSFSSLKTACALVPMADCGALRGCLGDYS